MSLLGDYFGGFSGSGGNSSAAKAGTYAGNVSPFGVGIRAVRGKDVIQDPNDFLGQLPAATGLAEQKGGPFGVDTYGSAPGAVDKVHTAQGYDPNLFAGLRGQLEGQANGTAPSLAGMQARAAGDQNAKQFLGALAGAGGMNPGMAARLAGQQFAQVGQGTANAAAQARLEEQHQAQGLLGQLGSTEAGLQQANNQFNTEAYNRQLGQDSQNQAAFEQARAQQIAEMEARRRQGNIDLRNGMVTGAMGAGSGAASGGLGALGQALPMLLAL
jgi:hypothetical protein